VSVNVKIILVESKMSYSKFYLAENVPNELLIVCKGIPFLNAQSNSCAVLHAV